LGPVAKPVGPKAGTVIPKMYLGEGVPKFTNFGGEFVFLN